MPARRLLLLPLIPLIPLSAQEPDRPAWNIEQVHGPVDEGTGRTYGYHGYWTRDWTAVEPALGTMEANGRS